MSITRKLHRGIAKESMHKAGHRNITKPYGNKAKKKGNSAFSIYWREYGSNGQKSDKEF